mmetsp:Transcript_85736/g.239714  ORF Transcript_85736/g.239714 Transcript_85736/m.239714 type:complete len:219 (-) Transcript_85736:1261-1917(-)
MFPSAGMCSAGVVLAVPLAGEGPLLDAAGTDLDSVLPAWFRRPPARIAGVVGKPGRAQERGVRGALVEKLDGEAEGQPHPGNQHGNEAPSHVLPRGRLLVRAECVVDVPTFLVVVDGLRHLGLVAVAVAGFFPCSPHLPGEVVLICREILRGRYEPHRVLEGRGERPFPGPPRGAVRFRWHWRLVNTGPAEPDQLVGVDDVDDVADVHEYVTDVSDLL